MAIKDQINNIRQSPQVANQSIELKRSKVNISSVTFVARITHLGKSNVRHGVRNVQIVEATIISKRNVGVTV